tara:strand:- start:1086 stop:1661 length:576 start_codon:yes stop_codon:yes gene_type:complete
MIAGKSILAIIPTRLGSKRLKQKNIMIFKNKPLFVWSYISAKKSKYIDKILISTESKKVINIARSYGYRSNVLRDKNLSLDKTKSEEVIFNIVKKYKKYKYFILLQPTSPLRNYEDIDKSLELIIKKKKDFLVSVFGKKNKYNGAIYINKISEFLKKKKFSFNKKIYFKMPLKKSIDIDFLKDFKKAERLF